MVATTAVDPAPGSYGVEYFFECQEDPSLNSGWVSDPYYSVQVDDQFDYYSFTVRARDTSPNNNTNDWSCICDADNLPICNCIGVP